MNQPATSRPARLNGAADAFSTDDLRWVVSQFKVPEPTSIFLFPRRGNINLHTYEVHAGDAIYLLQKINPVVFVSPQRVVEAELASIGAQREALKAHPVPGWRHIELVDTVEGSPWLDLSDESGKSIWRLMVYIDESVCYKSLSELPAREDQLALAKETGRGLALYSKLTSSIDAGKVE
ncbi:MAG TPA: hypothetical protein VGE01_14210, partial [Fimbriimonas sp.]